MPFSSVNYNCLYGESSSNINRQGQIVGNTCQIDNLKNDLGYDSLEIVSLIFEIEETFNITFDSSDLTFENMETIKDLINLIKKTLAYETI